MGKPKTTTPPKPAAETRGVNIVVSCTPTYKLWLETLARSDRTTVAQIIDQGVVALARAKGIAPPPPR
jgi:hypothetical protein